jgi:hypothetical protein
MVPFSPATTPVSADIKKTEFNRVMAPEFNWVHFPPPLVVLSIVPFTPAAKPVLVSIKNTEERRSG